VIEHRREEDLAELATGAVVGAERALVLQHVVGCSRCRQELADLTRAADDLLSLAPDREPPAGFESAVIARLSADSHAKPRRMRRRILLSLAAAVVGAAFGAAAVWQVTADDREVAHDQRATMELAGGKQFTAIPLTTTVGSRAGTVFIYQGHPSWLVVSLAEAPVDGDYDMIVHDRDGVSYTGDVCEVEGGVGMDGYRLVRPVTDIASVELVGPGGVRLSAWP